ncbi:MAG: YgjV family protein [Alphaproteobacteria bacterium]|nr:YgjV family protein [Alphaproteobacteria bacterium]
MGDWGSAVYVTSQILQGLAYLLLMFTFFIISRKLQLAAVIIASVFMGAGFLLLGGGMGAAVLGVAVCRDVTSYYLNGARKPEDRSKITKSDWWLLALWATLASALSLFAYHGLPSLFAYFGMMSFTVAIWQKNQAIYRILGVLAAVFWIIYNVVLDSFVGTVLEGVFLLSAVMGLILYLKNYSSFRKV